VAVVLDDFTPLRHRLEVGRDLIDLGHDPLLPVRGRGEQGQGVVA